MEACKERFSEVTFQKAESMSAKMESIILPEWRKRLLEHLSTVLILFELVLSAIFILLGYAKGSMYLRGIGVGLVIAWVTSAIAYIFKRKASK